MRLRLAWGRRGTRDAAARGDVLVVVDVLRFTSMVATAVQRGAIIRPLDWTTGARGGSLSPLDYLDVDAGDRFEVASPNGATCCSYGHELFAGALLNASATA